MASGLYWTQYPIESSPVAVARNLHRIPIVSLKFFFDSAIPIVEQKNVQAVRKELRGRKMITQAGRMAGFPNNPIQTTKNKAATFRPLKTFMEKTLSVCQKLLKRDPLLDVVYKPNPSPTSERENDARPDSYLKLAGSKEAWINVVLPIEVMAIDNTTNCYDNYLKLIWGSHHILGNDPCRRFTFGMTIENNQARLWYFSRAHVMVSERFDFIEEYDYVIQIILGLAFSDQEQIGYDPTIERITIEGMTQYRILVGEIKYITEETLSDFRASAFVGRATRVWETYIEGDDSKTTYAIKDVWLVDDAESEGDIWRNLETHIPKDVMEKHFLTVVNDGYVIDKKGEKVSTLGFMRQHRLDGNIVGFLDTDPTANNRFARYRIDTASLRSSPVGAPSPYPDDQQSGETRPLGPRQLWFQPRNHYRVVFKQVCVSYHDLKDMGVMLNSLRDLTLTLEALSDAGFVHRDVSTGNILWDPISLSARLGDLEYLKHIGDESCHGVKTGTAEFMAIEVHQGHYLFRPNRRVEEDVETIVSQWEEILDQPIYPFRYNAIHDLESVWWVYLWTLVRHVLQNYFNDPPESHDLTAQKRLFDTLFPRPQAPSNREHAFKVDAFLISKKKAFPPAFFGLLSTVEALRATLESRYIVAELNADGIDLSAIKNLHSTATKIFDVAIKLASKENIPGLMSLHKARVELKGKSPPKVASVESGGRGKPRLSEETPPVPSSSKRKRDASSPSQIAGTSSQTAGPSSNMRASKKVKKTSTCNQYSRLVV